MDGPGFITVQYGENQKEIFNTWCPCLVLLKNMQKKCIKKDENKPEPQKENSPNGITVAVDLVDLKGAVRNLREHMNDYAHNYIDNRETYVLIKIETNVEEETIKFTSLLQNIERIYPGVKVKLDTMSTRKPVTTSKGSRWAAIKTVTKLTALSKKSTISQATAALKPANRRGSVAESVGSNSDTGRKTPGGKSGRTRKKSKENR